MLYSSAAEHGKGASTVNTLIDHGYAGRIIDMSSDFRFKDISTFESLFNVKHPAPELISEFEYGQPELFGPYSTRYIANPGCFATGMLLAIWPIYQCTTEAYASVTAITGASGSGIRPKPTTHFPERDGNVRAYKVLEHQHLAEILQLVGSSIHMTMVPVSGPWTRGIWGAIQLKSPLPEPDDIAKWFTSLYDPHPLIRLWPNQLPELQYAVGSPYCDLGWVMREDDLVIGFALDNMLRGAASQAIQNMNLLFNLPITTGLIAKNSLMKTELIFKDEDTFLIPTYKKMPVALVRGKGCYVWDSDGNRYLDFYGGHCVTAPWSLPSPGC